MIHIGSNISKYRKEAGVTQLELAQYLSVSPQAVSKWEQEISVPDIYLIPKIALFFSISIDTLFGTTDLNTISLLVSRYTIQPTDKNYKEALDAIHTILNTDPENTDGLKQLIKLEFHRSHEFLIKGKDVCQKLLKVSKNKSDQEKAIIQLIRANVMLGTESLIEVYVNHFKDTKSAEDFNYLLIVLGAYYQHAEMLRWGTDYLHTFTLQEQLSIYPNLMEAAYVLKDIEYAQTCFEFITQHTNNIHQIFNAWLLLWKTYKKIGNEAEANKCKTSLIAQLPQQGYNEYMLDKINRQLIGEDSPFLNIL